MTHTPEQIRELIEAGTAANAELGAWMSAALDDRNVCDEMKEDIQSWFAVKDTLLSALEQVLGESERRGEALAWYGEQARLARLIHSEGDEGRRKLAEDGGERARTALQEDNSHE